MIHKKSTIGEAAQDLMPENATVIQTSDFTIKKEVDGSPELITNTTLPLQITVDFDEDLTGENISVIREHTDANGDVTAEILPATVDGTNVTFESDKFSKFAFIKTNSSKEDGNEQPRAGTDTPDKTDTTGKTSDVKTGDTANPTIWTVLFVIAGAAVLTLLYKKKQRS